MESEEIIGIIGSLSGLIGVLITSYVSIMTLKKTLWNDKPKLTVKLNKAIISGIKGEQYAVKVANVGTRPYTITLLGFKIGRNSGKLAIPIPLGSVQLPYVLEPGKTCNFWTEVKKLDESIKKNTPRKRIKIRAYLQDYVGDVFDSNFCLAILKEDEIYKIALITRRLYYLLLKKFIP